MPDETVITEDGSEAGGEQPLNDGSTAEEEQPDFLEVLAESQTGAPEPAPESEDTGTEGDGDGEDDSQYGKFKTADAVYEAYKELETKSTKSSQSNAELNEQLNKYRGYIADIARKTVDGNGKAETKEPSKPEFTEEENADMLEKIAAAPAEFAAGIIQEAVDKALEAATSQSEKQSSAQESFDHEYEASLTNAEKMLQDDERIGAVYSDKFHNMVIGELRENPLLSEVMNMPQAGQENGDMQQIVNACYSQAANNVIATNANAIYQNLLQEQKAKAAGLKRTKTVPSKGSRNAGVIKGVAGSEEGNIDDFLGINKRER